MTWLAAGCAGLAAALLLRPGPDLPQPRRVPGWLVAACGASLLGLWLAGPVLLLAIPAAAAVRRLVAMRVRRHRAEATADRVLETSELLAAELAVGLPSARCLERAAESWPVLGPAARAAELGSDVPAALRELACRPGAGQLRLVAAAWTVAHRSGGGLADALSRVATSIRADRATRRVVRSELASARATARLIAALPWLVLVVGGSGSWRFLFGTPLGTACLAAGLALGLAGLWWIERIADGVGA
jgi:tight adherence protein B